MSWLTKRRSAFVDEFIESYVRWREACEDVGAAYRRWADSEPQQRNLAFATYRAALQREERAATIHSHWVAAAPGWAEEAA
jgi:DNA-binding SARP family transcriptional activator